MIHFLNSCHRQRNGYLAILLAAFVLTLTACSNEPTVTESNASEETAVTSENPAVEGNSVATGQFEGRSDHVVSGGVEIVESNGQYFVQLGDDFSLDDAPDPKVGLGKDGYDPKTKSGKLISFKGASSYKIPENIDVNTYNEVYIWCEKFSVPLGVASIAFQ